MNASPTIKPAPRPAGRRSFTTGWIRRRYLIGRHLMRQVASNRGATALEWVMLVGVIGIPSYYLCMMALSILTAHYRMLTTLNGLPFP